MSRLCEDCVCIVIGGVNGIGKEYVLMLVEYGVKVVVNDFGGVCDGIGGDLFLVQFVVDEIKVVGGEVVVNFGDVFFFSDVKEMVQQVVDMFGCFDVLINNVGILCDCMFVNMIEVEWDVVIVVYFKGMFGFVYYVVVYWCDQSKVGNFIDV